MTLRKMDELVDIAFPHNIAFITYDFYSLESYLALSDPWNIGRSSLLVET